jgi:hypothetical protein
MVVAVAAFAAGMPASSSAQTTSADSLRRHAPTRQKSKEEVKERMTVIGATEMPGEYQWERKKSARTAMFSSMLMPGLGQMYNGRKWKAAIFFGGFGSFVAIAWVERKSAQYYLAVRDDQDPGSTEWQEADLFYQFHRENALDFVWWAGAIWLVNVLDAFVDAHLFDVRGVDPSVIKGSDNSKYYGVSVDF